METKTTDKSKGYTLVSKKRKKSSNSDTEARTAKKDKVMKPRLRLGQDSDDSENLTLKALLDERTNTISYASDEYTSYAPRTLLHLDCSQTINAPH
ncbi:hypothetical protein J6590_080993 [Homalodisca vitripennis]|nr:hypothetical protein J6590_080993 [Homalodisca vitripennis]